MLVSCSPPRQSVNLARVLLWDLVLPRQDQPFSEGFHQVTNLTHCCQDRQGWHSIDEAGSMLLE